MRSVLLAVLMVVSLTGASQANMLTFEDLYKGPKSEGNIPVDYQGFIWSGNFQTYPSAHWMSKDAIPGTYYGYEAGTRDNVSFVNYGGANVTISRDNSFSLKSAYVTAAWSDYIDSLSFKGYLNGTEVFYRGFDAFKTHQTFYEFNTPFIDTLVIGGGRMVIDDMTYENMSTVVTPEPASMVLFGLGGTAMALRRFRQRQV